MGEILVEIMRKNFDAPLEETGDFVGPFPSGAPAIFIDAVARLGHESGIIGGVGKDDFGTCILNRLEGDGVDTSAIRESDGVATGVAFVTYFSDGSRKFIYHMENSAAGQIDVDDVREEYFDGSSALHISGSTLSMGEKMKEACYTAVEMAEDKNMFVSLDPNIRVELGEIEESRKIIGPVLEASDIVTPSDEELQAITGRKDKRRAVGKLLDGGAEIVALKRGNNGCELYTGDDSAEIPAFSVEEVDPTGAGDAFSAAITVGYLEDMPLRKLGLFANAVGGRAVTVRGPMEGLADREEIEKMIDYYNRENIL